jgi:hypothetical protein
LDSPLPENGIPAQVFATDTGSFKYTMELAALEIFEPVVTEISRVTAILVVGEESRPHRHSFRIYLARHSLRRCPFLPQAAQTLAALRGVHAA